MEFSNRLVDGRGIGNAKQLLRDQFSRETDVPRKLRALWTLYTIGGTDEAFLLPLLKSPNEHLRAWGIRHPRRALAHRCAADADEVDRHDAIWTQQRPAPAVGGAELTPSPAVSRSSTRLAAADPSSLVRLVLASTMQRMPFSQRPAVAAGLLVTHKEDATDKNLPLMVWYALIPIARDRSRRRSRRSAPRASCARRASTSRGASPRTSTTSPGPVNTVDCRGSRPLRGLPVRHRGRPHAGTSGPAGRREAGRRGTRSRRRAALRRMPRFAEKVRALDVAARQRRRARRRRARSRSMARRRPRPAQAALQSLLDARAPDLRQIAEQLMRVRTVNAVAATALATFNDPAIATMLLDAYPQFDAADRPKLMAALTSRPAYAGALLEAVAAGRVPRSACPPSTRSRSAASTTPPSRAGWAKSGVRSATRRRPRSSSWRSYKAELTPAQLAAADLSQGRAVFADDVRAPATCSTAKAARSAPI